MIKRYLDVKKHLVESVLLFYQCGVYQFCIHRLSSGLTSGACRRLVDLMFNSRIFIFGIQEHKNRLRGEYFSLTG